MHGTRWAALAFAAALCACETAPGVGDCPFRLAAGDACVSTPVTRITVENVRPGDEDWWLPYPQWSYNHEIEGYTDRPSYDVGDTVKVSISSRAGHEVHWRLYRIGWYGGRGARLVTDGVVDASAQPLPATSTWSVPCRPQWPTTLAIPTDADWVSGVYALRLDAHGHTSFITFVVREDARVADIVYQRSDFTDAMYNNWDGASMHSSWYGDHPQWVSLDRVQRSPTYYLYPYSAGFFTFEVSTVRFLEREGYDVKYISELDTHENPHALDSGRVFLTAGHDEYWTAQMRDQVQGARDRGMNMAFLSGDTCDGYLRVSDDDPHLISVTQLGATESDFIRNSWDMESYTPDGPPHDNPSDTLTGTHYGGWCGVFNNACINDAFAKLRDTYEPDVVDAKHPMLRGMPPGVHLGRMMGYEYELQGTSPAGTGPFVPPHSQRIGELADVVELVHGPPVMIAYETDDGTKVFHAGSMHYGHGLDDWAGRHAFRRGAHEGEDCTSDDDDCFDVAIDAAQQMTINMFADMGAFPHSPRGPFVQPTTSCDWNAPTISCVPEEPTLRTVADRAAR